MSKNDLRAKHTPGPWEYHGQLSGSENHHGYRVRGKYVVAHVFPLDENGTGGLANARLISTAPELLEACKQAAYLIKESGFRCPMTEEFFDETFQKLADAIAKAEGNDA